MKKNLFMMVALVAGVSVMTSCGGSSKQVVAQTQVLQSSGNYADAFGPTASVPLARPDNAEYWYEVGVATGTKSNFSDLQDNALLSAQRRIAMKMKHAYKGVVSDYANSYTTKRGTDTQSKMERAGDRIIDAIVGNTDGLDYRQNLDDKGNLTYFVLIGVSKKETSDKIANAISKDEKLGMDFKESEFRKTMDEKFAKFKEEQ